MVKRKDMIICGKQVHYFRIGPERGEISSRKFTLRYMHTMARSVYAANGTL